MTKRQEFKRILEAHGVTATPALLDDLECAGRRARTQGQAEHKALVALFCEMTGRKIPLPTSTEERRATAKLWWQPITRIQKEANGEAELCLRIAIERMRRDGLTIAYPRSVEAVALAVSGELMMGINGSEPRGFAGIREFRRQHGL